MPALAGVERVERDAMKNRPLISRAVADFDVTGRTIEGFAYRWETPYRVTDDGSRYYSEAYGRTSADKTIKERGTFPVYYWHSLMPNMPGSKSRWAGEPFGPVVFRAAREGLAYTSTFSKTQGADEMLELIHDKVLGDVSISAYPIKVRSDVPRVDVFYDEIAIAELSLAPIGKGQYPDARVELVRTEPTIDSNQRRMQLLRGGFH